MRVTTSLSNSNLRDWEELKRYVSRDVESITGVINGRLSLTDNLQTTLATVVFPAANTEVRVPHTLQTLPTGYILAGSTVDMRVFDGATANTKTDLYLKASGAGTARVLVF